MMGDYRDELPTDELPDEYAALADAREVMREVLGLIEELRGSAKKLGDAIVGSGFPAREWVGPDAALALLGEQFPDVSLDAFLTRLAEFAAGMGPAWLRGGYAEIARFNDEAQVLHGVARPLRVFAQRQRMLPVRERGDLPLERALADGRVGTQLDLMAGHLRDLDALAPYIVPLTPSEWATLDPASAQPAQQAQRPAAGPDASASLPSVFSQQQWLLSSEPSSAQPAQPAQFAQFAQFAQPAQSPDAPPLEYAGATDTQQGFSRLRGFAPPPLETSAKGKDMPSAESPHLVVRVPNGYGLLALLQRHKWLVLGITILTLSAGTGLLSLAALRTNAALHTSHLTATPQALHLTCAGKSATATLTVHDSGTSPLTWTLQPPAALRLSATHGTLKPGASGHLTATATTRKSAQGALTLVVSDGTLTVPYTVSCP